MNTISSIARLCAVAVGLFFGLSATNMTQAASARAIDHGPIGVMGDHYHRAREWMLSVAEGRSVGEGREFLRALD